MSRNSAEQVTETAGSARSGWDGASSQGPALTAPKVPQGTAVGNSSPLGDLSSRQGERLTGLCPESITPRRRRLKPGCSSEELIKAPFTPTLARPRGASGGCGCIPRQAPAVTEMLRPFKPSPCSSHTRRSRVTRGRCRAPQEGAGLGRVVVILKQGRRKPAAAVPLHAGLLRPDE